MRQPLAFFSWRWLRRRALPGGALQLRPSLAIHPLRVESVAWIAERKDVLCAFFFVCSLLAYVHYRQKPSPGRYAGGL